MLRHTHNFPHTTTFPGGSPATTMHQNMCSDAVRGRARSSGTVRRCWTASNYNHDSSSKHLPTTSDHRTLASRPWLETRNPQNRANRKKTTTNTKTNTVYIQQSSTHFSSSDLIKMCVNPSRVSNFELATCLHEIHIPQPTHHTDTQ